MALRLAESCRSSSPAVGGAAPGSGRPGVLQAVQGQVSIRPVRVGLCEGNKGAGQGVEVSES